MAFILGYFLLGAVVVILIFLIVLRVMEKKFHTKIIAGKNSRNKFYIAKMSKMNTTSPKQTIKSLDRIAKSFFMEAFKIKGTAEYSELQNLFKKKNNKVAQEFCQIMTVELYSKEDIRSDKLQKLVDLLTTIIEKNRIITKEEKIELDQKSKKGQKTETKKQIVTQTVLDQKIQQAPVTPVKTPVKTKSVVKKASVTPVKKNTSVAKAQTPIKKK